MTYRTVAQIEWVMELLAAWFPQLCTREPLPYLSVDGSQIHALRIRAGAGQNRRGVLVVGGVHARELMNPDAIVDLQLDLVRAYVGGTGLVYENKSFSRDEIRTILECLDVWMIPCANPDGREYVQNHDGLWRKNRSDLPDSACYGVDLNRNYNIVWGATSGHASCSKCNDEYVGPSAWSEPETKNIRWFLDHHRVDVFLDVHSYTGLVLYPWGHAPTQTTDPNQNFTNLVVEKCKPLSPSNHREYMPWRDRVRYQTVARRVAEVIEEVRGSTYVPEPVFDLYDEVVTGTGAEWAYSRHIANPAKRKTYGFAFETGPDTGNRATSFHPDDPSHIQREAKAGILALLQQSICAIELIGGLFPKGRDAADSIREVRDSTLSTTKAGRGWLGVFERAQLPVLTAVLADKRLTRDATALLARAGELLDRDEAITGSDVERGLAFLDALGTRDLPKAVRRDLDAVRKIVKRSAGDTPDALFARVMRTAPAPHGRKVRT